MRVVLIVRIWWIPDILIILWRYFPCVPAMLLWTLIGSEVLYGIVYQSGGIHAITRSGSTRRKGRWTHTFLRPPMSSAIHFTPIQHTLPFLHDVL